MTVHRKERWCFSIALAGVVALLLIATPATAPAAPDPVIAAAGDIACDSAAAPGGGSCQQQATSDLLLSLKPAAVLTLGDEQYEDGALAKFQSFYDPAWGRLKPITHPAPGNHEYGTSGATGYFSYFGAAAGPPGRGYYSYDIGTWHLISLNSNCGDAGGCNAGSPQETWLKADLAAHASHCTLAYWHHPHFSSGPHGNDDGGGTGAFWSDLYSAGADIVLSGHDHDYERFARQTPTGTPDPARGIREFVVGTGGRSHYSFKTPQPNSEVRNSDTFGVLLLTLHRGSYDWRFAPVAGKTFTDAGSGGCHSPLKRQSRTRLRVRGPRRQKLAHGSIKLFASCSAACTVQASATVRIGRRKKIAGSTASQALPRRKRVKLEIAFAKPDARALKRALARHRRLRVRVNVVATDSSGQQVIKGKSIRLRR